MLVVQRRLQLYTYGDEVVGICAMKVGDPNARWERFLALKSFVEALSEIRLNTQSLEHKYTHPNQALLGRVVALVDSIV